MSYIDLSADIGEGGLNDEAILALLTSASIACGGHAGDEMTMLRTIEAAASANVRIGAHPSYPDRINFGRVSLAMSTERLLDSIVGQVEALRSVARRVGAAIAYLKPHGALYHDAAWISSIAEAMGVASDKVDLPLMLLSGSLLNDVAEDMGIPFIKEGFIDRGYRHDGSLLPRDEPGAIIDNVEDAVGQAFVLAEHVDSLCVHSDNPQALEFLAAVRPRLENAGYRLGYE